jgi:DNA gyrase/topoisomerase IV subunit A
MKLVEGEFVTQPEIIKLHDSNEKRILLGDNEHNVYLLNNKGEDVWKFESQGQISSAIQTYKYFQKDFILFGCEDNHLYCLNYKGNLSWKYKTGGVITSKPLIEKFTDETQETIVFCSHDKTIYLLNFYGQLLDKKKTKGFITSNPKVVKDNKKDIKYLVAGTSSREQSVIFYNPFKKMKDIDFANRVTVQPTVINLMNQDKKYEYLMFSAHNHYIYFIDIMEEIGKLENKFFKYNLPGILVDKPKLIKSKDDNENYLVCTNNKNEIIVKKIIL